MTGDVRTRLRRSSRVVRAAVTAVALLLAGALPALSDQQKDYDFTIDLHMPDTVGGVIDVAVTATRLVSVPSSVTWFSILTGPDGREVARAGPQTDTVNSPLPPGGTSTLGFEYRPEANGTYVVRVLRRLDGQDVPVAEARGSTDTVLPPPPRHARLQVQNVVTTPESPQVGEIAQVAVTVGNAGPVPGDADVPLTVTRPGLPPETVGVARLVGVPPGARLTATVAWTPAAPLDGARLDAVLGDSGATQWWSSAEPASPQPEPSGGGADSP